MNIFLLQFFLALLINNNSYKNLLSMTAVKSNYTLIFKVDKQPHILNKKSSYITQNNLSLTEEEQDFKNIIKPLISQNIAKKSMGEIMQEVSYKFLGSAYQAGLLDRSKTESLFVSFKEFDCLLFVENVLAMARNIAVQDINYQTFTNNLKDQRYVNGEINGYCSRLHYFSDWIDDNQKRGNVENITSKLGGIPLNKKLDFMSSHRNLYPQLMNDNVNYKCIVNRENYINKLNISYLPTVKIKQIYSQLKPGDIIALTTNIAGLDVTHTGLIYRNPDGKIGFIHASPAGQVTIAQDLEKYVKNVKNTIGIMVIRPIDPRQIQ